MNSPTRFRSSNKYFLNRKTNIRALENVLLQRGNIILGGGNDFLCQKMFS